MAAATVAPVSWKRKQGRPGVAELPCHKARNKALAQRNRRIYGAVTRKRNPLTQAEAGALYGVDQSIVSEIVRNPCSGQAR